MVRAKDEHAPYLAQLGIPTEESRRLDEYLAFVSDWNRRTNLTGASSPAERVHILVADVWHALPHLKGESLIDIGSGNGSPGLVLALLRPSLKVTLIEPRSRRWAFLREAARKVERADIEVVRARCEEFLGAPAHSVTMRAVGLDLDVAGALVEPGGDLLVFGGRPQATGAWICAESHSMGGSTLWVFRRAEDVSRET